MRKLCHRHLCGAGYGVGVLSGKDVGISDRHAGKNAFEGFVEIRVCVAVQIIADF